MLRKSDKFIFVLIFGLLLFLNFNRHAKHGSFNYHSELWADKAGYHVFLPALFYYDFDASQFPEDIAKKTGTGFSLDLKNNKVLTKYPIGVALLEFPFFTLGAAIDKITQTDAPLGYTPTQHKMIGLSTVFYTTLGLLLLFVSLSDTKRAVRYLVLFLAVFGTNFLFYMTRDGGLSHAYSFFTFAAVLYTLKRFCVPFGNWKWLTLATVFIVLGCLIRPINVLFYGLASLVVLLPNQTVFLQNRKAILKGILIALPFSLLLLLPQLMYYKYAFNDLLAYSYNDERFLYLENPRIARVWFAPANGLFLYSPLFLLVVIGIIKQFKSNKTQSITLAVFFMTITYLYAAWWTPGLGCGYGHRGFIEFLPFFCLPVAFTLQKMRWNVASIAISVITLGYISFLVSFQYKYDGCWYGNGYWDWNEILRIIGLN